MPSLFIKEWEEFLDEVVPKTASPTQISGTKKAFYCGALALVSMTARMSSDGQEVTDEDVNSYDDLVREIVAACKSFTRDHEKN